MNPNRTLEERISQDVRELTKLLESATEAKDIMSELDTETKMTVWIKVLVRDAYEGDLVDEMFHDILVKECEFFERRAKHSRARLQWIREQPKAKDRVQAGLIEMLKLALENEVRTLMISQQSRMGYLFLSLLKKRAERKEVDRQGALLRESLKREQERREKLMRTYVS